MDSLCDWFKANTLSLHIARTNYIFSRMGMIMLTVALVFVLVLVRSDEKRFLGFHSDRKLALKDHIKYVVQYFSSTSYNVWYDLMGIYLSIIFKETSSSYEKQAVQLINKTEYDAHSAEHFEACNILMLRWIYRLGDRVHKTLPRPLMEHTTLNSACHDHNTRQRQVLHVSNCRICLASIRVNTKILQILI